MLKGDCDTHLRSCWRSGRRLRSRRRHSLDFRNVTLRHQTHRIVAAKLHGTRRTLMRYSTARSGLLKLARKAFITWG